jgi:glycosyltransferase 2 family protein
VSTVASLLTRAASSRTVRLLITAAILAYLATRIDMPRAAQALVRIDLRYLAAVLGLVALDRSVMILRWILLLRARGAKVAATTAARIFLVSSFVGSFLPAGVGGDAARAWGLSRETSQGSEALASVAVDRLLGVLALAVMACVGLLVWAPPSGSDWRIPAAAALTAGACAAAFWMDRLLRLLVPADRHEGPVASRLIKLGDAVSRYRDHRGALAHVMAWSIVVQLLRITQAYLLGRGLGIDVSFGYYLLVMPIGLFMLLLPISVSGLGVPQAAIVWLLEPVGVASEPAFALSTLIVLTGLAGNLPGLWLWLAERRAPRRV